MSWLYCCIMWVDQCTLLDCSCSCLWVGNWSSQNAVVGHVWAGVCWWLWGWGCEVCYIQDLHDCMWQSSQPYPHSHHHTPAHTWPTTAFWLDQPPTHCMSNPNVYIDLSHILPKKQPWQSKQKQNIQYNLAWQHAIWKKQWKTKNSFR